MSAAHVDRNEYLGDPRFADVPTAMLISKERAAYWAEKIKRGEFLGDEKQAPPSCTTHLCTMDSRGNAVTLTHTLLMALLARRRDLATLRACGYTLRQVWATVVKSAIRVIGLARRIRCCSPCSISPRSCCRAALKSVSPGRNITTISGELSSASQ